MQPFEFVQPGSVSEVIAAIVDSNGQDVMLWGGGTATVLMMKQGLVAPRRLVGLYRLQHLQGITEDASGGLRIGACTRLRELEQSRLLHGILPCLAQTAGSIANVRVRNAAMLGGHLVHADPAQDLPPLLLVLDAEVRLESLAGNRSLPLSDFFVDYMETAVRPDELLTELRIPKAALARRSRYVKFTPRSQNDFATVGVACSVAVADDGHTCTEARIAVGGAGATVVRIPEAEALLSGRSLTPRLCQQTAQIVAERVEPWDDDRGSSTYKRAMSSVWTERILNSLAGSQVAAG